MSKLLQREVSAFKLFPSAYWQCSVIIAGRLVTRLYHGYTKRESIRMFANEINQEDK